MSSHREAPETSKDPVADNTDTYAFVTPDAPDTVTLIANFIPLQKPDGGPNFYEFGDDVAYDINIANSGKGKADITYRFMFTTKVRNPKTFLYNTGPIENINSTNWNRPQYYSVQRIEGGKTRLLAKDLPCPPVNVGKRSVPKYESIGGQAVRFVGNRKFFAGQRADAFHVDLGSVFDLGTLRPFQSAHLISTPDATGRNGLQAFNVHTIAMQVPISDLTRNGDAPTNVNSPGSVIGVWAAASRRKSKIYDEKKGEYVVTGPWQQVSRLGNPLVNEVLIPMAEKDKWNRSQPVNDKNFSEYINKPELQGLLPVLYPGVFPNLAKYKKPRADLNAILHTGIPSGIVDGFQNYTGPVESDMLRLNVAIKPTKKPNNLGLVAGDAAGFPNGRRIDDDVTTIELRAVAGLTIPLVDKSFKPDGAASAVTDGSKNTNAALLKVFPYLGLPGGGYMTSPGKTRSW